MQLALCYCSRACSRVESGAQSAGCVQWFVLILTCTAACPVCRTPTRLSDSHIVCMVVHWAPMVGYGALRDDMMSEGPHEGPIYLAGKRKEKTPLSWLSAPSPATRRHNTPRAASSQARPRPATTHHATATFPKFFGKKIREFGVVENPSAQRVATRKLKSQKTQRTHKTHRLLPLSTFSSSSRRQRS